MNRRDFLRTALAALFTPFLAPGSPRWPSIITTTGVEVPVKPLGEKTVCGRCGKVIEANKAESCWWCQADLCQDCWDRIGHCGHPEAHMQNYEAAHIRQPGQSVATARRVVWSEDELGAFFVAELFLDGRKVGGIGNYYEDIDESTGRRYSKEDQILMNSQYLCIHGQGEDCWQCGREWAAYNYGDEDPIWYDNDDPANWIAMS
jgi:hypothetical protein